MDERVVGVPRQNETLVRVIERAEEGRRGSRDCRTGLPRSRRVVRRLARSEKERKRVGEGWEVRGWWPADFLDRLASSGSEGQTERCGAHPIFFANLRPSAFEHTAGKQTIVHDLQKRLDGSQRALGARRIHYGHVPDANGAVGALLSLDDFMAPSANISTSLQRPDEAMGVFSGRIE